MDVAVENLKRETRSIRLNLKSSGPDFFMSHPPYFFVPTLTTDPQNDLLCHHHIVLAENFTADETDSVRVKPRENDEVCHFLRSVQALWVKCDVYCIML